MNDMLGLAMRKEECIGGKKTRRNKGKLKSRKEEKSRRRAS
jgi:hypothetical protein